MPLTRSLVRRAQAAAGGSGVVGLIPCLAALGLVLLQAGAAVNLWNARERGQFNFSPSSSLVISEMLRFAGAALLLKREIRKRAGADAEYSWLDSSSITSAEADVDAEDGPSSGRFAAINEKHSLGARIDGVKTLWRYVWGETDVRFAFMRVALLQMLSNNLMFVNLLLVDPGTVHLTKSGIAVGAALVTAPVFGLKGPKTWWMAFLVQTSGLVLSQYLPQHPTRASTYQLRLYTSLVAQASFSALSDIYGERLLKGIDVGANGASVVLGAMGAVLNLFVYILVRYHNVYEPGFLYGYDGKAVSVVLLGTIVSMASTVAYKRVDAWTRWFTNDVTAVVLLLTFAFTYSTQYSSFVIPGTALILIATLAYMKFAPAKDHFAPPIEYRAPGSPPPSGSFKKLKLGLLAVAGVIGAGIVPFATVAEPPHTPEYRLYMRDETEGHCLIPPAEIIPPFTEKTEPYKITNGAGNLSASPFSNTLAMIRWNSKRTERVPLLMKYEPFFHTVHVSMPEMMEDKPADYHNLTHSQYPHHETVYMQVARTMKLVLDTQPEIEGLLYFHFDSWIDPMAWVDTNRESIWFPTTHNTRQSSGAGYGPRYMCMTDPQTYPDWWRWSLKLNEMVVAANGEVLRMNRGYAVEEKEFCVGWSDIFYVPRRFFADFIFLSHVFGCADVFHEVAIPSMINIIDRSRRSGAARYQSVIERIGDCWGGCCDDSATAHDVKWTRCGHRLNYLDQEIVDTHYGRLDEEAAWLGKTAAGGKSRKRGALV
ncbi:uncharacterized protein GLRG_07676 [Colletotrichum graminicola M1.001]|uniref:UDP-galactose transporter n=1 Tax=Colletotrichum graminicola (strain M1.001 / M2 / FGSC 10212) TaxID=645133 RepID=E3QNP9_COLGM|nr:uncharacterized protein GLRG_07676 [Colletotrichum graminicola M1.001]EFQ32406.1 hypothetical protein GLRG_07676 [Colletotrichum graminicola M1.001]